MCRSFSLKGKKTKLKRIEGDYFLINAHHTVGEVVVGGAGGGVSGQFLPFCEDMCSCTCNGKYWRCLGGTLCTEHLASAVLEELKGNHTTV